MILNRSRKRRLECDQLETRALLSGATGHHVTAVSAHLAMSRMARAAAPAAQMRTMGVGAVAAASTGGSLVNVPTAPGNSDVTALQAVASENNLVVFLSQFEALSGSNPTTQSLALSLLNDARDIDLALNGFAGGHAVALPGNVAGSSQVIAQQMIAGVRSKNVDQTFSTLIVQAETNLLNQVSALSTSAQDASIRSFATGLLPTIQSDVSAAMGTGTLAPVATTPSSTTLGDNDLQTVATYYGINVMERFLGQITLLTTRSVPIALYSAKLIGDHEQGALALGAYAASTGTYLPASIPSALAPMAQTIVTALHKVRPRNTAVYDRTYLSQMIMGHTGALKLTAQVIATTQNPFIEQFALNVQPTIWMHLITAKTLRRAPG
ncbi:DUF4142 domain-containing protein [Aquisphaera insulae]|uniref:DUF4142 domain-containing protein n=1 Tax=Aquisphaera insulae TaxID=2712864 RepID=UPI0013EAC8E6|nr:DUF4142 domain-containing protein [Aquisphaera insulae]